MAPDQDLGPSAARRFKIDIRLRSESKAVRNDPSPAQLEAIRKHPGPSSTRVTSRDIRKAFTTLDDCDDFELSICNQCIYSEDDEGPLLEWLEEINGFVTVSESVSDVSRQTQIGYCGAQLIRKKDIIATFYDDMEKCSYWASVFAFDLFDRYGRLRPDFKEHPIKKGSEVWQDELDGGDILFIDYLAIDKNHRRLGLGGKLVTVILDRIRMKSLTFFVVVGPFTFAAQEASDGGTPRDEILLQNFGTEIYVEFFRSLGFRRIGSSEWFAFAIDPSHPSHRIPAPGDYDPAELISSIPAEPQLESLYRKFSHWEDMDCAQHLEHLVSNSAFLPEWFDCADEHGNTMLHLAALRTKPACIFIIEDIMPHRFNGVRNRAGYTPLGALNHSLEVCRTQELQGHRIVPCSDRFTGRTPSQRDCVARLEITFHPGLSAEALCRVAAGCTCSECVDGFLSPKMRWALRCQAEEKLREVLRVVKQSDEVNLDYLPLLNLDYFPHNIRHEILASRSMQLGLVGLLLRFSMCLRNKKAPLRETVLDDLETVIGPISRVTNLTAPASLEVADPSMTPEIVISSADIDGLVTKVPDICSIMALHLFTAAMEEDKFCGNGRHQRVYGDYIFFLPPCRNDHEFGYASLLCGYDPVFPIRWRSVIDLTEAAAAAEVDDDLGEEDARRSTTAEAEVSREEPFQDSTLGSEGSANNSPGDELGKRTIEITTVASGDEPAGMTSTLTGLADGTEVGSRNNPDEDVSVDHHFNGKGT